VVQRHVLYLDEISPSQAAAWHKSIEVFDEDAGHSRTLGPFPEDRCIAVTPDSSVVPLRLSDIRLCRPRQWDACWLAEQLWGELQLDRFWSDRLPANRKGTRWDQVLQVLVSSASLHREASGNCTATGSAAVPWRTCWDQTFAWPSRTNSTPVMIFC
jgi:hypothetical protein